MWLDIINQTRRRIDTSRCTTSTSSRSTSADTAAWAAGSWHAIGQTTLTGTADEIGRRVGELAAKGITEIIYQPTGPDITGELEAFHTAARAAVSAAAQNNTTHPGIDAPARA